MKTLLCLLIVLITTQTSFSQNTNQKVANLLNRSDFFTLSEVYPHVKDSLSSFLNQMSDALLKSYFNQPKEACNAFEKFFRNNNNLNPLLASGMIYLWADNFQKIGDYQAAINLIDGYLSNYESEEQEKIKKSFQNLYIYCKNYSAFSQSKVIFPLKDVHVPLRLKPTGKEDMYSMFIPVELNGKTHQFIFDTGAGDNMVSEQFAKENNISILSDSISLLGIGYGYARLGYIDKLQIGEITYTNVSFLVVPHIIPEVIQEKNHEIHAVLGLPFIRKLKEFQILPHKRKILFPQSESLSSNCSKNLMLDQSTLLLNIESNNKNFPVQFDSGNVSSSLNAKYFEEHKELIQERGTKDTIRIGGFGGIDTLVTYKVPQINFSIGSSEFKMKNLNVLTDHQLSTNKKMFGVFGVNFIRKFEMVKVNLKQMKMEVFTSKDITLSKFKGRLKINHKKKDYRKLHYEQFDPQKSAWEATNKTDFKENQEKQKRQFNVTKRKY